MEFAIPREVDTLELSEKGVAVPIVSLETGAPIVIGEGDKALPLTITVQGADSKAYQNAVLEMERKRNKVIGAGGDFDNMEGLADVLSMVTIAWTGFTDKEGRPAQCTRENAKKLYNDVPFIRDYISTRVNNRGFFIKASSPS